MIKINTKMPRSCAECFALVGDELRGYICQLTGQTMEDTEFVKLLSKQRALKMDKCPLQEVDTELKPCPFCGSAVELKKSPMWKNFNGITHGYTGCYQLEITCPQCGCSTSKTKGDTVTCTEEQAKNYIVTNWNTRDGE